MDIFDSNFSDEMRTDSSKATRLQKWHLETVCKFIDLWETSEEFFNLVLLFLDERQIEEIEDWIKNNSEDPETEEMRKSYRRRRGNSETLSEKIMDFIQENRRNEKELYKLLKQKILNELQNAPEPPELIVQRLAKIQNDFELDAIELEIIRFLLLKSEFQEYDRLFDNRYSKRTIDSTVNYVSGILKTSPEKIRRAFRKDNKLVQLEFLGYHRHNDFLFELDESIKDYLFGFTDEKFSINCYEVDTADVQDSNLFRIQDESLKMVKGLLANNQKSNILFYGEPGTGKTESVRSIIRELGKKAYFVNPVNGMEDDFSENNESLIRNLYLSVKMAQKDNGVVVFDEADTFLNRGFFGESLKMNGSKTFLNWYLDKSKVNIIWITNHTYWIESSVKRRFDFSIYFPDFTKIERLIVWEKILSNTRLEKLLSKEFIDSASEVYKLNPGSIKKSVESANASLTDEELLDVIKVEKRIEEALSCQYELLYDKKPKRIRKEVHGYDASILHTDTDMKALENSVRKFYENRSELKQGMNILFWGIPGTGKTEFAKYLGKEFGKEIIIKKASDLLSPFVGMTERLIARAFEEAEKSGSILLIDEADSFLGSRTGAHRSWEITQVNEFLTCMENYEGVLICTTNFLKNQDEAAMRRFAWKVEFKPLKPSDKLKLYMNYFSGIFNGLEPDESQSLRLKDIPTLTPGDFRAVWNRIRYIEGELNHSRIIDELDKEVKYKSENQKTVGF